VAVADTTTPEMPLSWMGGSGGRKRVESSKRCGKTRHLVVTTANLKFKLHFNPILSDPQKEQVIEITLLSLTLELSLTLLFHFYTHTHTHTHMMV